MISNKISLLNTYYQLEPIIDSRELMIGDIIPFHQPYIRGPYDFVYPGLNRTINNNELIKAQPEWLEKKLDMQFIIRCFKNMNKNYIIHRTPIIPCTFLIIQYYDITKKSVGVFTGYRFTNSADMIIMTMYGLFDADL